MNSSEWINNTLKCHKNVLISFVIRSLGHNKNLNENIIRQVFLFNLKVQKKYLSDIL